MPTSGVGLLYIMSIGMRIYTWRPNIKKNGVSPVVDASVVGQAQPSELVLPVEGFVRG